MGKMKVLFLQKIEFMFSSNICSSKYMLKVKIRVGDIAQLEECMPHMYKTLDSILRTTQN